MDKLAFFFKYLSFLIKSGNEHSIHSPFVFDLYTKSIKSKKQFYIFAAIEKLRKELYLSKQEIIVSDFGAGSKVHNSNKRTIAGIAKTAEKSPRFAQLIFCLIEYLKPKVIIDLGTSLGLTTIYEGLANKEANVYTFEGCPETSRIARENFKKLKVQNIELIEGNIDLTLENQLKQLSKIDFVFFDANHRYEPTIRYFNLCLTKTHEDTCFVFDDIHWSDEMDKAWQEIIKDDRVTVSIDLFYLGIVFFRKKQPKEHFILRH